MCCSFSDEASNSKLQGRHNSFPNMMLAGILLAIVGIDAVQAA
jgi:hypothetical protein